MLQILYKVKMKRSIILSLLMIIFFAIIIDAFASDKKTLPAINIKNIRGETVNIKNLHNDGKPFVINFWATWCKPCILELNTIKEVYDNWQSETGVKIFAISIDDSRNSKKVAPFVKGRGWKYEVLLDENSDLRRALNVNNPPHTFLVNGKGEIVWEHNGYAPGDEKELYRQIKKLIAESNK